LVLVAIRAEPLRAANGSGSALTVRSYPQTRRQAMTTPILVASDGRPGSLGAVRLAHLLAQRMRRPLSVVTVLEPVPYEGLDPGYPLLVPFPLLDNERAEGLCGAVREQLRQVGGGDAESDIHLAVGAPAPCIVRRAVEIDACMIVVGQRRHSAAERWLGVDTSLKTVHLAHLPVLVVPPDVRKLPSSAVVGVDFSEFSLDAAQTALDLLADDAVLNLLHVAWAVPTQHGWDEDVQWARTYNAGATARLEEVKLQLQFQRPFQGEARLTTGDPAAEILHEADRIGAELIAVGSHGYGFLGRIVAGSVSSRLLRRAARPLLVAPPREVVSEVAAAGAAGITAIGQPA
jgi:nucleotide-binding universal stress UspA family protein